MMVVLESGHLGWVTIDDMMLGCGDVVYHQPIR